MYAYDSVSSAGSATLFRDKYCTGDSAYFQAGEPGELIGYNKEDMKYWNFSSDTLSHVMVPYGYTVTIYDDDGFTGSYATFEGLEDDHGRMVCQ